MDKEHLCSICESVDKTSSLQIVLKNGLQTLIAQSKKLKDNKWSKWDQIESTYVHGSCRKKYFRLKAATKVTDCDMPSTSTAYSHTNNLINLNATIDDNEDHDDGECNVTNSGDFNFNEYCFICAEKFSSKKSKLKRIEHDYMKEKILYACNMKRDEKSSSIKQRIINIKSLRELNIKYHSNCLTNFLYIPTGNKVGERTYPEVTEAFSRVCDFIESRPNTVFTLEELKIAMGDYEIKTETLYKKLDEQFGDDIHIQKYPGTAPAFLYKCSELTKLCARYKYSNTPLSETEKKFILDLGASILHEEIVSTKHETKKYPPSNNFLSHVNNDIPPLLSRFLRKLAVRSDDIKITSAAHVIMSAVKPHTFISTLLLSVALYFYRKTGCKIAVDVLNKLGFCCSYYNIQLYEASVIINSPGVEITYSPFLQFVFDNTDHNVQTLDGRNPFHFLGGVAIYTPWDSVTYRDDVLKCTRMPTASDIAKSCEIEILTPTCTNDDDKQELSFRKLDTLSITNPDRFPNHYMVYLWLKLLKLESKHSPELDELNNTDIPEIPSWRGFIEKLSDAEITEKSQIICLPFIKQPPSEITTIYTSLRTSLARCKEVGQRFCFVTFDQPLYLKARELVANDPSVENVIIRLGGFHMLMSYFGSIGHIMAGSGLEDLWSEIYAPLTAKHMMSGNAFGRAERAHILTFTALGLSILSKMNNRFDPNYVIEMIDIMKGWSSTDPETHATIGDCNTNCISDMTTEFLNTIEDLKQLGPTAQLWIQYFEAVTVALQFIEAERLGNWSVHLQCVKKMLPLFHAAGHYHYAKCGQIYLQDMENLSKIMTPSQYNQFTKYFTVHRTDKAFSGIWTDMTIEQTLNRSFGTALKRGRGTTDSVITRYYASMPSAFNILEGLEDYVNVKTCNSEQHVELSRSRMQRDIQDINILISWFEKNSPFVENTQLLSLSTGVLANPDIYNCHNAYNVGMALMKRLEGMSYRKIAMHTTTTRVKNLLEASLKTKIQSPSSATIDSTLLFQKLATVHRGNEELIKAAFEYELSPYPLSLFDVNGVMRKTKKSDLYMCFKACGYEPRISKYVVDGGMLLFAKSFSSGMTFESICESYFNYVTTKYGRDCVVVFDGYNKELIGTKSYERLCNRGKVCGPTVEVSLEKKARVSSTKFFENYISKGNFVKLLMEYFDSHNIKTEQAVEDADTLIVKTAMEIAASGAQCAVAGNDTDLLVLITALAADNDPELFFYKWEPSSKKRTNRAFYSSKGNADLKDFILFAHAICGCDTTNALYGKGKKTVVHMLMENENLQEEIKIFTKEGQKIEDLIKVSKAVMFHLYKAPDNVETLGQLRYHLFSKAAYFGVNEVKLAELPPTEGSLIQHTKRVYYQIQNWLGRNLHPDSWGWQRTSTLLLPRMTDSDVAPQELLSSISCSCTKLCSTARCSCKKAGIECSAFCKVCQGIMCENSTSKPRLIGCIDQDEDGDEVDSTYINDSIEDVNMESDD